ncbi:protocadherin alpha-7-like [Latimeria chalumnae]|uniref:protocadherin alpha-7-like n=1 Tax=Latimeria chalumnae TaxID=7897 RepID=UPI0006D90E9D|nr:PREDICTED: protocadherin alpha-10-like [Latimeria chalumnae]|eukprot:XP_014350997.1 PREDICTED: protocadherin alpha-10-like [Latimeria chalumnae]
MTLASQNWFVTWRSLYLLILLSIGGFVQGQIRYSISEGLKPGTFVGNIANDLGIDVQKLMIRTFRIASGDRKEYFQVNMENGILFTNERIDREELCAKISVCLIILEVIIDNPLELHRVEVEITDVNDNFPIFPQNDILLTIAESTLVGYKVFLDRAYDADEGTNSLSTYELSSNDHFVLDVQTNSDNSKSPELVLIKALDREQQPTQILTLTAIDGGNPVRYGTALITVSVQDANDNTPVFDQSVYKISLIENVPNGTLLIKIQATDLDEGPNAEIFYSLSVLIPDNARTVFTIDGKTGEMRVTAPVDFEESNIYEIHVQATDNGHFAMTGHCKVLVEIIDTNDNNPEVTVTSLSSPVKEDTLPGSVIALINVADRDSGMNGQVHCHISGAPPFQLKLNFLNYYALLLNKPLDREIISEYNITITATDSGTPPLSTSKTVLVQVSDVNDNAPRFLAPSYTFSIRENNVPGSLIFTVSALDPDLEQNAMIKYAILETTVLSVPISSYISMKSDSGVIYAMQSFDHEKVKVLQFEVKAEDGGFPSLSSNVTIHLFILDQNDNIPTILPPYSSNGSPLTEMIPRAANKGHILAKVRAIDNDSGHNAWLSYHLLQQAEASLFTVELHTGEIRTRRSIVDTDDEQVLIIAIKDHGEPPLTATVTLTILVMDSDQKLLEMSDYGLRSKIEDPVSYMNLYLIVAIVSISMIFLLTIITFVALRYHYSQNITSGCGKQAVYGDFESCIYSQSQRYNLSSTKGTYNNDFLGLMPEIHDHLANSVNNGKNVSEGIVDLQNNADEFMKAANKIRRVMEISNDWALWVKEKRIWGSDLRNYQFESVKMLENLCSVSATLIIIIISFSLSTAG